MVTAANGRDPTGMHSCFYYHLCHVALFQNTTIEERVSLLEIQVDVIQDEVTEVDERVGLLEGDVNFLFDETVIQDERLFSLEQTTDAINAELDEEFDTVDSQLEGEFKRNNVSSLTCLSIYLCIYL